MSSRERNRIPEYQGEPGRISNESIIIIKPTENKRALPLLIIIKPTEKTGEHYDIIIIKPRENRRGNESFDGFKRRTLSD